MYIFIYKISKIIYEYSYIHTCIYIKNTIYILNIYVIVPRIWVFPNF